MSKIVELKTEEIANVHGGVATAQVSVSQSATFTKPVTTTSFNLANNTQTTANLSVAGIRFS